MLPNEVEMLSRMWFPVARVQDVDHGPFGATLLGRRLVVYRAGGGIPFPQPGWSGDHAAHCRGSAKTAGCVGNRELRVRRGPWRNYVQRVKIIFNGVSGGPVPAPRLPGSAHVACIGRIAPEKGQLEFLKAAKIIHRSFPNARFTIYGATLFGEPGAEAYEREVRARAVGVPVEFAGWITDVYAALARIDVLLVPSAPPEATTRVILEAYAAGVPVVAFASGGIPGSSMMGSPEP